VEIKSSKKKQEMKKDPVMDSLNRAVEAVTENSKVALTVVIAVVVVIGGIMAYSAFSNSSLKKAQEEFGVAMVAYETGVSNPNGSQQNIEKAVQGFKAVIDHHKGSSQAIYSAYMLGHLFLESERYDEAINWFNLAVSKNQHCGFVGAAALEGLAASYEGKNSNDQALVFLRKALDDKRLDYRKNALQWKIALLSNGLNKTADAEAACRAILADTTQSAADYKQKAENLLAQIQVVKQ